MMVLKVKGVHTVRFQINDYAALCTQVIVSDSFMQLPKCKQHMDTWTQMISVSHSLILHMEHMEPLLSSASY